MLGRDTNGNFIPSSVGTKTYNAKDINGQIIGQTTITINSNKTVVSDTRLNDGNTYSFELSKDAKVTSTTVVNQGETIHYSFEYSDDPITGVPTLVSWAGWVDSNGECKALTTNDPAEFFDPNIDPSKAKSDFNVNNNPNLGSQNTDPNDPTQSVSSSNNTLIKGGGYTVSGVGDVNEDTGIFAWINNTITGDWRPGAQMLAAVEAIGSGFMKAMTWTVTGITDFLGSAIDYASKFFTDLLPTDPLVIDLNGDGVKLTDYGTSPVLFDIDHDGGSREQTGWVSAQDGIVVYDLNNNGKIDDISETLSEYFNGAVGGNGNAGEKKFSDGVAALASLDSNHDNQFTSADAAWNSVKVWVDDNHDGKSWKDSNNNGVLDAGETSELQTLTQLGISQFDLNATRQSGLLRNGNEVLATTTFIQNGQSHEAVAAQFIANPNGSTFTASGSGTLTQTEGNVSSYAAGDPAPGQTQGETIDVGQKGVNNALGGSGNDTLIGDAGNNWLAGGAGVDSFSAGAGDDVLVVDADDDHIDGGDGYDLVQVAGDAGITLNLARNNIEAVQGGRGDDFLYGGGNNSVFMRGGDGNDVLIGGAANDVLNGENDIDLIDGGAGNDIIRGGRGEDQLNGADGDDLIYGGQDDDTLSGGLGNDVLTGAQGDDQIDGGDGIDIAEFSGSYADYRITQINADTFRVVDSKAGRDGADTLKGIEKLNFADVSGVDITLDNPTPVKDVITIADRVGVKLIKVADLLANDQDWQGDALHITAISDLQGGTIAGTYNATTKQWKPTLTANGEIKFTPDATYTGVMSFKYKIADVNNSPGAQIIEIGTTNGAEARGQVFIRTPDMPSDSLFTDEWYLNDINVLPVWQDYTGKGVKIGQFEPEMPFSTDSQVFDYRHPDLQANVDPDWLTDPNNTAPENFSQHATLVAGVMVATRDGQGAVGVAYDAKLSGQCIQNGSTVVQNISSALDSFKNYDVVNNSWGPTENFSLATTPVGSLPSGIEDAVNFGRDGLGTVVVMSGGNDRQSGGNTNTNLLTANRGVITTGAINAEGDISTLNIAQTPFSNPGASILVSAPGSNIASTSSVLLGNDGTIFGNDISTSQGTSFAAPIVSGVVALILEANPNLGWRDVQQILALSAKAVNDPTTDTVWNTANNWNGGGMHTSHDYGFGEVDARAAVRLAETWVGTHILDNERHLVAGEGSLTAAAGLGIAINDGTVVTRTLAIGAGIRAEHVDVSLDIAHGNWGDLTVELISPTGTISKLVSNPGTSTANPGGDVGDGQLVYSFDTTHSYGENAQGNWQLRITDRAGLGAGTLNGWKVDVYGSDYNESTYTVGDAPLISATGDNTYFYTDEFATAPGTARATLNDTNAGVDIINASAVSMGSTINLNNGTTSKVAGRSLVIKGDVEYAFGGDGNDTLTGNTLSNRLSGGRGDDTINGGSGVDLLDGGSGTDTLTGGADSDLFVIRKAENSTDTITDFSAIAAGEKILLVGFENVVDFSTITLTQEGVNTRLGLGGGQTLLLQNVTPSQISEQNFSFFSDDEMLETYISYVTATAATWYGDAAIQNTLLPSTYGNLRAFGLGGNDVIGSQTQNDLIDGGDGNDTIWGEYPGYAPNPGADWIEGGAGDDTLYGGAGGDLMFGGSGNDQLNGEEGNDILRGATGADILLGGNGDDLLLGGAGSDYLEGGAGNDVLFLEGDLGTINGTDYTYYGTRVGGAGADTFKVTSQGGANEGYAASGAQFSGYNLIADFEPNQAGELIDLTEQKWLHRFEELMISTVTINGATLTRITATDGVNELWINMYGVNSTSLNAGHFKFATLPGFIYGGSGNDSLDGDAGSNTLDGGIGADTMTGRTGDDTYVVDNMGDVVNELPGGGYDTVKAGVTYTLTDDVESLVLTGTGNIDGTGNQLANRITGNGGNNRLDGGAGVDALIGGAGDDTYIIDNQADSIIEKENEGTDSVQSSVSFTLGQQLENLSLTGTSSINATGNSLSNSLIGNSGDNVLDGAAGDDTMAGGLGNDVYYLDSSADVINEGLNEGTDTVMSGITYTLGSNVENLTLMGAAALNGTGNELGNSLLGNSAVNTLTGNAGNDQLDGGAGADKLIGGAGDDTYVIDVATDLLTELAGQGNDKVLSAITYSLVDTDGTGANGGNIENLTLTGTAAVNATGNALVNQLVGNSAANILDGGAGADTMEGGDGDDTYVVDNALDSIVEYFGEGNDLVQSSVSYTLQDYVDNLTLTGAAAINATGNTLDNILIGNTGGNTLTGGDGNDRLDGGTGNDILNGGQGDDTFVVNVLTDTIVENAGAGNDTVETKITYTLGAELENLTLTGTGTVSGTGNAADNVLIGNGAANTLTGLAGNDVLDGGLGADKMLGGQGDDTYVINVATDRLTELVGEGNDTVLSPITFSLVDTDGTGANGSNIENLTLTGTAAVNATGNALVNLLIGNSAANTLDGGVGVDTLKGGAGDDTYLVDSSADIVVENLNEGTDLVQSSAADYTLPNNVENLTLIMTGGGTGISGTGNALDNVLIGNTAFNTLNGGAGNDRLDGGGGYDQMIGGVGDDIYIVDSSSDIVTENLNEGIDTVQTGITYALAANVENLALTGTGIVNGYGNELDNTLIGNSAANLLIDDAGNDNLDGGLGNDHLYGGLGNDYLDGGLGNDYLYGGTGDDIYVINVATDVLTEYAGEGTDTVLSAITYSLVDTDGTGANGGNIENLTLTGTAAVNATGNALDNILIGNSAANTLDGGAGVDTLKGGAGDDTYILDRSAGNTLDYVVENFDEGTDLVLSNFVTYTLPDNVENLTLTIVNGNGAFDGIGNSLDNVLTGNDAPNYLNGGAGNDWLDGGLSGDSLFGGLGNDTYIVNATNDIVTEYFNEGVDTVQSSITYALAANVENLTLTGSVAVNGTGNELDNILIGNSAANSLSGGAGNDRLDGGTGSDNMSGGIGDDTYVVNVATDVITENLNEGTDTVEASATYTLGNNIENLTLVGTAAINGTGNALNNIVTGNSAANTLTGGAGNDRLDGKAGADKMLGGLGNDTYVVDVATDTITENLNEGIDTVETGIAYTLGANVENLTLTGTSAINGTGNTLNNTLLGNSADNTLNGGLGNDILTGGEGFDHFLFNTILGASNVDTLTDFMSGTDKIDLSKAIFTAFSAVTIGGSLSNAELGNHLLYNANTGALSYDADGSAGVGAAVQIAVVGTANHPAELQGIDFNIAA